MTSDDGNGADHDDAQLAGKWYADRFRIGQNAFEFKVDCGHEGDRAGSPVYFRVIANPTNARALFRQLGISLLGYVDRFGLIDEEGDERGNP